MLELSSSIRAGVLGDYGCLSVLRSLVECFTSVVLAFCLLNDYLVESLEDLENTENTKKSTATEGTNSEPANRSGTDSDENNSASQGTHQTGPGADSSSSDHDGSDLASQGTNLDFGIARLLSTNLQLIPRPSTPEAIERELNIAMKALIKAKEETIVLLCSGKQKALAEYPTVSADGLIIAVLRFLAKGDTGTVTPVYLYRDHCSELVSDFFTATLTGGFLILFIYRDSLCGMHQSDYYWTISTALKRN